jgi:hypothetical protein
MTVRQSHETGALLAIPLVDSDDPSPGAESLPMRLAAPATAGHEPSPVALQLFEQLCLLGLELRIGEHTCIMELAKLLERT